MFRTRDVLVGHDETVQILYNDFTVFFVAIEGRPLGVYLIGAGYFHRETRILLSICLLPPSLFVLRRWWYHMCAPIKRSASRQ